MTDRTASLGLAQTSRAWISWLEVERGLLPSTIDCYRRELRLLWNVHRSNVASLTADELRAYLNTAGGKPATVAGRIAAFRSFYGFLVRIDYRPDDPTQKLDRPRLHRGLPKPVTDRDAILARLSPEMRLVAIVLLETGLRISEACSLNLSVPVPDQILVRGKGAKERIVLLTERARQALDELDGRMPYRKRTIQRNFQKAGTHAHAFRHTLACDLAAANCDLGEIQDILGHASPATTRVYSHYSTDRLRGAHARRTGLSQASTSS